MSSAWTHGRHQTPCWLWDRQSLLGRVDTGAGEGGTDLADKSAGGSLYTQMSVNLV